MKIINNLKYSRERLGLSQQQVADKLGISVTTYLHIEKGHHSPRLETLLLLTDLFEKQIEDMFFRKKV